MRINPGPPREGNSVQDHEGRGSDVTDVTPSRETLKLEKIQADERLTPGTWQPRTRPSDSTYQEPSFQDPRIQVAGVTQLAFPCPLSQEPRDILLIPQRTRPEAREGHGETFEVPSKHLVFGHLSRNSPKAVLFKCISQPRGASGPLGRKGQKKRLRGWDTASLTLARVDQSPQGNWGGRGGREGVVTF